MALTASATLAPFNRVVKLKQWSNLFSGFSRRSGTDFSFPRKNSQRKGVRPLKFASSSSSSVEPNGRGVADISEDEASRRLYAWPDNKKPRVCILGGGFGGLYTALRLESLVWPDEKKPQKRKNFINEKRGQGVRQQKYKNDRLKQERKEKLNSPNY
ncbi:hypothetical protein L484_025113 [Morus notabilis]|uniref:Uncharacterized protein n=1 Tax=Morus notabilis TaxID=981085 RepID=W9RAU4_9ROSA|nr:hypothetical protein L484_025113 [Morus notabilis]